MKKLFVNILSLAIALSLASCKGNNPETPGSQDPSSDAPTYSADPSSDAPLDPSLSDDKDYTMEISVSTRPDDLVGEGGSITYQLLVYSFADSNGDGIGDFKGIEQNLDYIYNLGARAIWLSPIHPAMSYHGYDILDYSAVNKDYGTEDDLKSLIHAAHQKGIKIYLDYVLNHAGSKHPYFLQAAKDRSSQWRTAFIFSSNPKKDIAEGRIDMIPFSSSYESTQWYKAPGTPNLGSKGRYHFKVDWTVATVPTVTVTTTTEPAQTSNTNISVAKYLFFGDSKNLRLYETDDNIFEITVDFDSDWGFLIRTSATEWGDKKWGAALGDQAITFGEPKVLVKGDAANDITFSAAEFYHSHMWTDWFADWNYHKAESSEKSLAFNHLASTVDKWIGFGIDGLRLDAVKHIYHNANSSENPVFLGKWYDRCNEAFHKAGGKGDFYMVGEQYSGAGEVAPYYKGVPGFFEFDFWNRLKWVLNEKTGCYFVKDIMGYQADYAKYRADYIEATKLSNHDESRTGSDLNKNLARMKQAGAFLLTAAGEPYIYQGEELGYWGKKDEGDEWVRTPIMWKADGSGLADKKLGTKIDRSMLTSSISVEVQNTELSSILSVYRRFGQTRNTFDCLGKGKMSKHPKYNDSNTTDKTVSCWYMTASSGQKALVVHNVGSSSVTLNFPDDDLNENIVELGEISVDGHNLTLGANSSVVFLQ